MVVLSAAIEAETRTKRVSWQIEQAIIAEACEQSRIGGNILVASRYKLIGVASRTCGAGEIVGARKLGLRKVWRNIICVPHFRRRLIEQVRRDLIVGEGDAVAGRVLRVGVVNLIRGCGFAVDVDDTVA